MTPARVTLPTMTFDHRLVIHRGGREIHLLFLGRAHTAGDVVAYIPSERVVATGDLMHGLLPYMGDGFPDEWPATLRALEALEFDRVIPGHGSIQEGKSRAGPVPRVRRGDHREGLPGDRERPDAG